MRRRACAGLDAEPREETFNSIHRRLILMAGGRRIVEDDGRTGDEGASDGDAAAHAAGEVGGRQVEGVSEFDESEDLLTRGSISSGSTPSS